MKNIFLIILSILFYFFITFITNSLNIFYPYTNLLLSSLFIIVIYSFNYKQRNLAFISYLLFTLVFLFYRHKVDININRDFYLFKWLKLIFKNRIVFLNILGNILLFMPYILIIKNKNYLLITISIVIILELMQYLTKRGVLDVVDITLNIFGCILIMPFRWRLYERQREVS